MKASSPIAGVCSGSSVMDLDTGDSHEDRHHGSVSLGLRRCIGDDFEQKTIRESNQQSRSRCRLRNPERSGKTESSIGRACFSKMLDPETPVVEDGTLGGSMAEGVRDIRSETSQKVKSRFESVRVESVREGIGNRSR